MNIDIKNALDKVLAICKSLDNIAGSGDITVAFINDIHLFINNISEKNSEDRFDFFSMVYLKGSDRSPADNTCRSSFYTSFDLISESKSKALFPENYSVFSVIISFFMELGRFYLTTMPDRKDISKDCFFTEIKKMQEYSALFELKSAEKTKKIEKRAETPHTNNGVRKTKKSTESQSISDEDEEIISAPEQEESLDELIEKLNSLIGLQGVKTEVKNIIDLIKVRNKGIEFGESVSDMSLHLVFYGNPGTGKTTVARLLGKIYKALGVLSSGQIVEVSRGDLVGGYVGSTAIKTREVIDKAMGGILFIDEAYSLTHAKGENDFGQESVDTILKAMEDHRDDFIVIVAGYPDLMKEFVASNPGLKSRFNLYINFEDYTPDELVDIFHYNSKNYVFEDGCEEYLIQYFNSLYNNRSSDYANGRDVRNFYEKVLRAQANRISPIIDEITLEDFKTITYSDLVRAADMMKTF